MRMKHQNLHLTDLLKVFHIHYTKVLKHFQNDVFYKYIFKIYIYLIFSFCEDFDILFLFLSNIHILNYVFFQNVSYYDVFFLKLNNILKHSSKKYDIVKCKHFKLISFYILSSFILLILYNFKLFLSLSNRLDYHFKNYVRKLLLSKH